MFAKFTSSDNLMNTIEQEIKEKKKELKWYKLKVKQISERAA